MRLLTALMIIAALCVGCFYYFSHSPKSEALEIPLGLPPIPWPADNAYSKAKADLGRLLYFDKRLSSDGTVSCATCHYRECGFGDCRPIAVGIDHHRGTRHSPTIINSAYSHYLFWDGRVTSLEEQCKGPIANPNEMSNDHNEHDAHMECQERVAEIKGYAPLFEKAFGTPEVSLERIAQAVATFERTVLSGNSPFDRYVSGDRKALSKAEVKGMYVFKNSGCTHCHSGFNFSDDQFNNIGVGMDAAHPDLGRFNITHDPKDWGAFRTPTLRDVEHSPPYMHDGSLPTLEAVVDYYDKGGIKNKNLHYLMTPLKLTDEEKESLVSFLRALSGEGWEHFNEPDQTEFPN